MQEHHVELRNGEKVFIRPLRPDDACLYPEFLAEVSSEDLRLRFFAAMQEVSPALVDRLVHYDPAKAMAFIAIEEDSGRMLGVVRLHDDPDKGSGEFAILLRTRLKGQGLGWLLMKHMIANAKAKGLKVIRGQVLPENTTMLDMCAQLGFSSRTDPHERGVREVSLPLDQVATDVLH